MVRPPLLVRKPGPGASEGVKSYTLCIFLRFFFDSLHIFMLFLVYLFYLLYLAGCKFFCGCKTGVIFQGVNFQHIWLTYIYAI